MPETPATKTPATGAPAKSDLRLDAMHVRAHMVKTSFGAAKAISQNFLAEFAALTESAYVAGYWPINDELDCRSLLTALHERGCRCLLPVVGRQGEPLVFRSWAPGISLVTSAWGIGEPGPDRPVHDPEILLTPLLAYDDQGWRLGYGGGFYDRSLVALRAQNPGGVRAIGLAYSAQQVDTVPHNEYDQRLDYVVTEDGVTKF
jgi:5-formyltetrahydrofolate cyclo-ligase